jgi:hypothetical protein
MNTTNEILETKRIRNLNRILKRVEADQKEPGDAAGELAAEICQEIDHEEDCAPRLLERDHMPKQIATDMLLNSQRLSNTMRKTCMRARENHYVSVQTKEAGIYKIARRFQRATLQQLSKWLRRAQQRRTDTAASLRSLKKDKSRPEEIQRSLAGILENRIEAFSQAIDTLQTELKSRHENISLRTH